MGDMEVVEDAEKAGERLAFSTGTSHADVEYAKEVLWEIGWL